MFLLLRPVRLLLRAMVLDSTPAQMSLGFAAGVMIGLVPRGNLLAIVLAFVLAATRLNLGIAALGALLAALIGSQFDTVFDQLGWMILSRPELADVWTWMYSQPLLPWTSFNNSVVMGSFVTGLLLFLPLHFCTRPLFNRYACTLSTYGKRSWLVRFITGAEMADRLGSV
jgi:uncharacterized protein (TIGR03546 family)